MNNRNYDDGENWDDERYGSFDWLNPLESNESEAHQEGKDEPTGVIMTFEYPADPDETSDDPDFEIYMKRDSQELGLSIICFPTLHREMHLLLFLDESIDKDPEPDKNIGQYVRLQKFLTFEAAEEHAKALIFDWKQSGVVNTDKKGNVWAISAARLITAALKNPMEQAFINVN